MKLDNINEEQYMTFNPKPKEFLPSRDIYMGLKSKRHDQTQEDRRTTIKKERTKNIKTDEAGRKTEQLKLMQIVEKKSDATGVIDEAKSDDQDAEQNKYYVESILCLWKINQQGQLKKLNQISFDYNFPYS